jgi:peptidoglycan/LPS O-acetylase OafA/YrhL
LDVQASRLKAAAVVLSRLTNSRATRRQFFWSVALSAGVKGTMQRDNENHHAIGLDFLRGMASIMVFITHLRGQTFAEFGALDTADQTPIVKALFLITRLGHEAVMAFFILSGFLVGGQIIRRVKAIHFDIKSYAIDRATRIFVPLIPAVILTAVIGICVFGESPHISQIIGNMFGFNGIMVDVLEHDNVLWSLSYEIWFYIIAGAIGCLITGRAGLFSIVLIVCAMSTFSIQNANFL